MIVCVFNKLYWLLFIFDIEFGWMEKYLGDWVYLGVFMRVFMEKID